jgi:hypothetical protein
MTLALGPNWAVASASTIRAWSLQALLRIEYAPLASLHLGLGATARALWASRAGAATHQGDTAGAVASVQYLVPVGPIELSAGPQLQALVRPISVQFAGLELFRVPNLVAGVSLDVSYPLRRR